MIYFKRKTELWIFGQMEFLDGWLDAPKICHLKFKNLDAIRFLPRSFVLIKFDEKGRFLNTKYVSRCAMQSIEGPKKMEVMLETCEAFFDCVPMQLHHIQLILIINRLPSLSNLFLPQQMSKSNHYELKQKISSCDQLH